MSIHMAVHMPVPAVGDPDVDTRAQTHVYAHGYTHDCACHRRPGCCALCPCRPAGSAADPSPGPPRPGRRC